MKRFAPDSLDITIICAALALITVSWCRKEYANIPFNAATIMLVFLRKVGPR